MKQSDHYRCIDAQCECEIVLVQMPRPGAGKSSWPACCYCGMPMQLVGAL